MSDAPSLEDLFRFSERRGFFQIPWEHVRELNALPLYQLCALSVGISPLYFETVEDEITPDQSDTIAELLEKNAYTPKPEYFEARRRCAVASTHLVPFGTLSIANGECLGVKSVVLVADFVRWARDLMGWTLPPEFPKPERVPARADTKPAPGQVEQETGETGIDWKELAREIADERHAADVRCSAYSTNAGIADAVAQEMRRRGISGSRGAPLSAATVLKEALQGGRWKRKPPPG